MTTEQTIKKNELELSLLNDAIDRLYMYPELVEEYKKKRKKVKERLRTNMNYLSSKI